MDSLIFALNAVTPIILVISVGYLLKKIGLINNDFSKKTNKLVFRCFLPVMLFLNLYKTDGIDELRWDYIIFAVVVLLVVFAIALPLTMIATKQNGRRGALLQACFRSNYALLGIPLAESLYGSEGVAVATLLGAAVIPALNILAVISLSIFREDGKRPTVKDILKGIINNPLIQSIAAGLVALLIRAFLENNNISFRISDIKPIYTLLEYLSRLATPLALLMLGAQFEFSAVRSLKNEIVLGTIMRTIIVPMIGIGGAYLLFSNTFTGAHFAALIAVFATPVSVSSVPMAQEMNGDTTLAGQLVIWSTLASAVSIFIIAFLLRYIGVFV
ncbi:MAG: AEC family transporter [Clostridia bacterium]|nr:AEC family transporter [Clostridia bacterium]